MEKQYLYIPMYINILGIRYYVNIFNIYLLVHILYSC